MTTKGAKIFRKSSVGGAGVTSTPIELHIIIGTVKENIKSHTHLDFNYLYRLYNNNIIVYFSRPSPPRLVRCAPRGTICHPPPPERTRKNNTKTLHTSFSRVLWYYNIMRLRHTRYQSTFNSRANLPRYRFWYRIVSTHRYILLLYVYNEIHAGRQGGD